MSAAAKSSNKVTASGYFGGIAINSNGTIFTVDGLSARNNTASKYDNRFIPAYYIDADDAKVAAYSAVLDSDTVNCYDFYSKNNRYEAIVLGGDATNNNDIFGVVTSWNALSSDDPSNCEYKLNMIVNGEEKEYYYDDDSTDDFNAAAADKTKLYAMKVNTNGNITALSLACEGKDGSTTTRTDNATYLGYVASNNGITVKNNAVTTESGATVSIASDAVVYQLNSDGIYEVKSVSDMKATDTNKWALLYDTDTDTDADRVADVVLITRATSQSSVMNNNIGTWTITGMKGTAPIASLGASYVDGTAVAGLTYTFTVVDGLSNSLPVTVVSDESNSDNITATNINGVVTVSVANTAAATDSGEFEIKSGDSTILTVTITVA